MSAFVMDSGKELAGAKDVLAYEGVTSKECLFRCRDPTG